VVLLGIHWEPIKNLGNIKKLPLGTLLKHDGNLIEGTPRLHLRLLPLEYRELMELTTISPSMGSNTLIHEDLVENFLIIEDGMLLSVS
jgi:hypothetical protein